MIFKGIENEKKACKKEKAQASYSAWLLPAPRPEACLGKKAQAPQPQERQAQIKDIQEVKKTWQKEESLARRPIAKKPQPKKPENEARE